MENITIPDEDYVDFIGLYCAQNVIKIKDVKDLTMVSNLLSEYMQNISKSPFGMDHLFNIKCGDISLTDVLNNIDFQNYTDLSNDEKKFLAFWKENGYSSLKNSISDADVIPLLLASTTAIHNLKMHKLKEFNNSILNTEKINKAIVEETHGVKMVDIQGMSVVFLGDLPTPTISHQVNSNVSMGTGSGFGITGNNGGGNFGGFKNPKTSYSSYDGYDGLSTISCHFSDEVSNSLCYYYLDVTDKEVVAFSKIDADVLHTEKALTSFGTRGTRAIDDKIWNEKKQNGGEIAFYRRSRDHETIEKSETPDGRIMPNAASYATAEDLAIIIKNFRNQAMIFIPGQFSEEKQEKVNANISEAIKIIEAEKILDATIKEDFAANFKNSEDISR